MEKIITRQQQKAIHKLFELWADALNDAGKGMFTVLKEYVDIPWTSYTVEQYLWIPLTQTNLADKNEAFTKQLASRIEVSMLPTIQEVISATSVKKGLSIYFGLVADALNDAGADMRIILKPNAEVWWTRNTVKEFIWRPVQKIQLKKDSTTQLLTKEIDQVYDTVNRHLGKHIDTISFPSIDEIITQYHYDR